MQPVYNGQTVFCQIMGFIPIKKFRRCVVRYNGNYRVYSFTCFDQFLCMAFGQLKYRESLRDIECCLRAMRGKLHHMGIKGKVSRSTIACANEKWNKQHLRRKASYGTSENAVKTQIWIAISVYLLVAIMKKQMKLDLSLCTILQIFSIALFEKMPILQALTDNDYKNKITNGQI